MRLSPLRQRRFSRGADGAEGARPDTELRVSSPAPLAAAQICLLLLMLIRWRLLLIYVARAVADAATRFLATPRTP